MLTTILVSLCIVLAFAGLMAVGQFFGRAPVQPKCNPDTCCMQGDNCSRRRGAGGRHA